MKELNNSLAIFIAAALGGWIRYESTVFFMMFSDFPWGSLVVNYLGIYLLVGLVKGYMTSKRVSSRLILALGTGFCGGLTTFSGLLLDSVKLVEKGRYTACFLYLILSILGGLLLAFCVQKEEMKR